jgi:23S rRNA (cytosine1962-C5)-methyltransferase
MLSAPIKYSLITSPDWTDFELLDSGDGRKLERFGPYRLIRPEAEAVWQPALSDADWQTAHARYTSAGDDSGGRWEFTQDMPSRWQIRYKQLKCWLQLRVSRHIGVFPEQASTWDWIADQVRLGIGRETNKDRPFNVLNLFGYTGLASLAALSAGAHVTHLDASKKAVNWTKENQQLSRLIDKPLRIIVDDAIKFIQREARRKVSYQGLILDPPKFGRGPKGEMWEFYRLLPKLFATCKEILDPHPQFIVLTAYAIKASPITLHQMLDEMVRGMPGSIEAGEIALMEKSAGRMLVTAIFARWNAAKNR